MSIQDYGPTQTRPRAEWPNEDRAYTEEVPVKDRSRLAILIELAERNHKRSIDCTQQITKLANHLTGYVPENEKQINQVQNGPKQNCALSHLDHLLVMQETEIIRIREALANLIDNLAG